MPLIQIRGTNGSGKTYLINKLISELGPPDGEHKFENGKFAASLWSQQKIAIFGKYTNACGGCDGFSWPGAAEDMEREIVKLHDEGYTSIVEGLTVSCWGLARLQRLKPLGLHVLQLNTPFEDCFSAILDRRAAKAASKGQEPKPLDRKNPWRKFTGLLSVMPFHRKGGIEINEYSRDEAAVELRRVLSL